MDINIQSIIAQPPPKRARSPVTITDPLNRAKVSDTQHSDAAETTTSSSNIQSQQSNLGVRTKEQEWVDKEIENTAKSAQGVLFSIAGRKYNKQLESIS